MISITSTLIHPGRPRLTGVSLATNEFDELCEDGFGIRFELGGELLQQEGKNTCAAEGKLEAERSERVLRSRRRSGVEIRVRARNSVNMRVI